MTYSGEPCPACSPRGGSRSCAVCSGTGVVIPMRRAAWERCRRIVAWIDGQGMGPREAMGLLGIGPGEWFQLRQGTLPIVQVERIGDAVGVT